LIDEIKELIVGVVGVVDSPFRNDVIGWVDSF